MRHLRIHPFMLVIALAAQLLLGAAEARAQYSLSWYTIDGGGMNAVGGTYSLGCTSGQPDASNALVGGTYSFSGGFWPGATPGPVCAGDIALPHNNTVDTDDLLLLLGSWGGCTLPCPPNCAADIALPKNCAVDTDDLLLLLGSWGACP